MCNVKRHGVFSMGRQREALFLLPSLAGVSLFVLAPFVDVVRRSFTDVMGESFVGLGNYKAVLANQAFRLAMGNTLKFLLVTVPLLLGLSLALANMAYFGRGRVYQKVCLLPMAVPVVSLVFVWKMAFHPNGMLNSYLGLSVDWINSSYAFAVLAASFLWKNIGYYVVLWITGLEGIPKSLYEAASLDGAGAVTRFFYITLPGLRPMVSAALVLALTGALKSYREAYLLAGEYPDKSIYLMQHMFHNWFRDMSVEKMAASAVVAVAVFAVMVYPLRRLSDSVQSV